MDNWQNPYGAKKTEKSRFKQNLILIIAGAVFVGAFIHMVYWGQYSTEILGLKIAKLTGSSSNEDLFRMAEICYKRGNPGCAVEAYTAVLRKNPQNTNAWAMLAKTYFRAKNFARAASTYGKYEEAGGDDPTVLYEYAKSLGQSGQIDQAAEKFEQVIGLKPGILQITVTKAYVKMLMDAGRNEQAIKVIKSFHGRSPNAKNYLNEELDYLEKNFRAEVGSGGAPPPSQLDQSASPPVDQSNTETATEDASQDEAPADGANTSGQGLPEEKAGAAEASEASQAQEATETPVQDVPPPPTE